MEWTIPACESLLDSFLVLQEMQSSPEARILSSRNCYLQSYQNGREQGFGLVVHVHNPGLEILALTWAHHRNSDRVRVYEGPYSLQTISEEAYRNSAIFDDYKDAAKHIVRRAVALTESKSE